MRLDRALKECACPYCHKKGELKRDPITRLLTCNACHVANISEDIVAFHNQSSSTVASLPTTEKANYVIERDQWVTDESTGMTIEGVAYFLPKLSQDEIPTLYVDKALCEFFAWLHKDAIANQKRWGRDYLRRTGRQVVAKTRHEGKLIKQYDYVES